MSCNSCRGRGWVIDLETRQQISCPTCKPKQEEKFGGVSVPDVPFISGISEKPIESEPETNEVIPDGPTDESI